MLLCYMFMFSKANWSFGSRMFDSESKVKSLGLIKTNTSFTLGFKCTLGKYLN